MVKEFDKKSLENSVLEFPDGKKVKFKGNFNVTCDGVGRRAKDPTGDIEESVDRSGSDSYLVVGFVSYGVKQTFSKRIGGHTVYSVLHIKYIDSD